MALLRAVAESEYFDVIAVAPRADLFVPLCVPLFPDMIIIDESAAGSDAKALASRIAPGRRIIPVVVGSGRGTSVTDASQLSVKQLHRSDPSARNDVQTALFAAATPIMTAKRTFLADELEEHAAKLRGASTGDDVRREVMAMASWPLDLIMLVDDGSYLLQLAEVIGQADSVPVPVVVAIDPGKTDGYAELSNVAPRRTRHLTEPTSVRRMEGVYVAPHDRQVQLWNENVHVAEGEFNIENLLASMGWLKSGGLTIVLSSDQETRAATLAKVGTHGGLIAMLDPACCDAPAAGRAAEQWPTPPLFIAPNELAWLLQRTVPRKG